jgi:hypothetical protein
VTGTSLDGTFAVGDAVEVGYRRRPARIRAIQTHGEAVERIGPGQRAALNLRGVDVGEVALEASQIRATLAARAFPDVVDLVSGVVYTTRDFMADPVPGQGAYTFRVSGSAALAAHGASGQAPAPRASLCRRVRPAREPSCCREISRSRRPPAEPTCYRVSNPPRMARAARACTFPNEGVPSSRAPCFRRRSRDHRRSRDPPQGRRAPGLTAARFDSTRNERAPPFDGARP